MTKVFSFAFERRILLKEYPKSFFIKEKLYDLNHKMPILV